LTRPRARSCPAPPLQALAIASPFDRYVFSDRSKSCADALSARVAAMRKKAPGLPPTDVLTGECDAGVLAWPPSSRTCGLIAP